MTRKRNRFGRRLGEKWASRKRADKVIPFRNI